MRFNPNLYAEGKVCLSLLGTFSGPGWESNVSTLFQLLMSIQALVFVRSAIENEPSHDGSASSPSGRLGVACYNSEVRLSTLRTAMTAMVRAPPLGFEAAVAKHFWGKRGELRGQVLLWAEEAVLLARMEMEGRRVRAVDPDAVAARVAAELRRLAERAKEVRLDRGSLGGSPFDERPFKLPATLPRWAGGATAAAGGGGGGGSGSANELEDYEPSFGVVGGAFGGGGSFSFGGTAAPSFPGAKAGPSGVKAKAAPPRGAPVPQSSAYTGPRSCLHLGVLMERLRRLAVGEAVEPHPNWAEMADAAAKEELSERAMAALAGKKGPAGPSAAPAANPLFASLALVLASGGSGAAAADLSLAAALEMDRGGALPSDFELLCTHRQAARQFWIAVETLEAAEELLLELAKLKKPEETPGSAL